jgi:hypothetical protein
MLLFVYRGMLPSVKKLLFQAVPGDDEASELSHSEKKLRRFYP